MNWLRKALSPHNRPWIVFALIVLLLLVGAYWYKRAFERRQEARIAWPDGQALIDREAVTKLKMERSTLDFQLLNVRKKYPVLTSVTAASDWSATVILSQLDPAVCESWRAYLGQVSPPVIQSDPSLQTFSALQDGYESEVERLARDAFAKNKPARLMNIRTNQFSALFSQSNFVEAGRRFDAAASTLADAQTVALRAAYWAAVAASVTNLNPRLSAYTLATLGAQAESDSLRQQLKKVDEKLVALGELPPGTAGQAGSLLDPERRAALRRSKAWLLEQKDFFILGLCAAILGFVLTLPPDLRDRRWLKILASVGLVGLGLLALEHAAGVFAFFACLAVAALLAALWTFHITLLLSKVLPETADSAGPTGKDTFGLRPAYEAAQRGEARVALALLKPRLLAEPLDYEALLLKARLQRQLNRRWGTKRTLEKLLSKSGLADIQRQRAEELFHNLDRPELACWQLGGSEVAVAGPEPRPESPTTPSEEPGEPECSDV